MSQGFLFSFKNDTESEISLSVKAGQDNCVDEFGNMPTPLTAGETSPNVYAQVRSMCENGVRTINFNPKDSNVGHSAGWLTLNFDKETNAQNPYGTISIQDYAAATITQSGNRTIQIAPTLVRGVDTGDEWAYATIHFNATIVS